MCEIKDWEKEINRLSNEIDELEAMQSSYTFDKERIADKYKERGDSYINLYLDDYIVHDTVNEECANKSIKDYEHTIRLFNEIHNDIKSIYSTMALGNAFKESFLPPHLSKYSFCEVEKKARGKYDKCVEFYFREMDKHTQQYHFVMLEQINLMVRKNAWKKSSYPKRVVVLHSLKSPESHMYLEGICYYAYKHNFEIWEYRFGKVMAFDEEDKYIKDRLCEACAVVFLASKDYCQKSSIIEFEIETMKTMKKKSDPISVFLVDLGNEELVGDFQKEIIGKIISKDEIEKIFTQEDIKDIYECRRLRLNK